MTFGTKRAVVACGIAALSAATVLAGSFLFSTPVKYDNGDTGPLDTERADFNGDGNLDLAVLTSGSAAGRRAVQFLLADASGKFTQKTTLATPYGSGIVSADFNGDGVLDLAVTQTSNKPSSDFLCTGVIPGTLIYLGQPAATAGGAPAFAFKTCVLGTSGVFLDDAAAGDFDGDGKVDLAVGDYGNKGLRMHLGNGDGTFKAALYAKGSQYLKITSPFAVADVNSDGRPDLIASTYGSIGTFFGTGGGNMQFTSTPASSGAFKYHWGIQSFAVGDINNDGALDIVGLETGSYTNPAVRETAFFTALGTQGGVLYNYGDSHPFPSLTLSATSGTVALGDFDNDGWPDAAAADIDGNAVRTYRNMTQGWMADDTIVKVGTQPKLLTGVSSEWSSEGNPTGPHGAIIVVDANKNAASRTWVVPGNN